MPSGLIYTSLRSQLIPSAYSRFPVELQRCGEHQDIRALELISHVSALLHTHHLRYHRSLKPASSSLAFPDWEEIDVQMAAGYCSTAWRVIGNILREGITSS